MGTTTAKFDDAFVFSRLYDPRSFGGDHRLKIYGRQEEGLNELGFNDWGRNPKDRFTGKSKTSLGHRPKIAGKLEGSQIFKERMRHMTKNLTGF
jgi:hypothetical protein